MVDAVCQILVLCQALGRELGMGGEKGDDNENERKEFFHRDADSIMVKGDSRSKGTQTLF